MSRRCARMLLMTSIVATFIVSALLFVALIVAEDSQRAPCLREPERETEGKRSAADPSELRQLNLALASTSNDQPPVNVAAEAGAGGLWQNEMDGLLRVLQSRNQSMIRTQHQVSDLRAALRRIEHRLDVVSAHSTGDSPGSEDKPPAPAAVMREPLSPQQQQVKQQVGLMTENAGLRGFSRALSRALDDRVVNSLRDIADKTSAERRRLPHFTVRQRSVHWKPRTAWEYFHNNITQYELYRNSSEQAYVDDLLKNMATLPVAGVEEMAKKGTQIKLIFTLSDGTKLLFKPMRISKDVEANPNHFVFNEMERHHAEIAAFHLDRLLDFRRVPPVSGRYINMTSEIRPLANKHLNKTFFTSPAGNLCFYAECKYYCDSHHAVCGSPDVIEGSCAAFLPSEDDMSRKTWPNPWAQLYTKRDKLPAWKTEANFCDDVRSHSPFDSGRRLLDIIDISVFDFLTGNLDRHHYYTFEEFGNFTAPILTDNGRGFGRARKDDVQLLAPLFQCCVIRASTFTKIMHFLLADRSVVPTGSGQSLSVAMRASLAGDVIPSVLNAAHLTALDRRVRTIALLLYHCLQRDTTSDFRQVVVDDGF